MQCPVCHSRRDEIAYWPEAHSLICLDSACGWQIRLGEDEVFDLFFARRRVRLCA